MVLGLIAGVAVHQLYGVETGRAVAGGLLAGMIIARFVPLPRKGG